MYANIDNPPGTIIQTASPRIDPERHIRDVSFLTGMLGLMARAREKIKYCKRQFDEYSPESSPFVSRDEWMAEFRKWCYINYRLERYYLKKVCELNSVTYKAVTE